MSFQGRELPIRLRTTMSGHVAPRQATYGQEETFALPPGPAGIPEKAAIRQAGHDGR